MRVYQGKGYEGVSIVNYGLTLNVTDGKARIEYDGLVGDYVDSVKSGKLSNGIRSIQLDNEQLAWLEDSKTWVKKQIEDQG
jgi:hypothetical protein